MTIVNQTASAPPRHSGAGFRAINHILSLAVVLALAAFFRLYGLNRESLWLDEGASIWFARLDLSQLMDPATGDHHPPLYYLLLHYWMNLFGSGDYSLRLMSALIGLCAVALMYVLGKRIFDRESGLLGALLLALSVFHVAYSQEVRMYGLVALLSLSSVFFFMELLSGKGAAATVGYVLSSILLMYTHDVGLLLIVSQNLYLVTLSLISSRRSKLSMRDWALLQAILALLIAPWAWIAVGQSRGMSDYYFWIPLPTLWSLVDSFREYASGSGYILIIFLVLSPLSAIAYKRVEGCFDWRNVIDSLQSYRWHISLSQLDRIYLLLVWLVVPIAGLFVLSYALSPIYYTRYTISASLAFYMLVAKGIANIRAPFAKWFVIISLVALSLINLGQYYNKVDKEQWREVATYVDRNATAGDLILFNGAAPSTVFDHYSSRTDIIKALVPSKDGLIDADSVRQLKEMIGAYNRVWVIRSHDRDYGDLVRQTIEETRTLFYREHYVGIGVLSFRKPSDSAP